MAELLELFDEFELERYRNFCKEHRHTDEGFFSSIGGDISVIVTGTGLGYIFECRCNRCGKIESITNTDNW